MRAGAETPFPSAGLLCKDAQEPDSPARRTRSTPCPSPPPRSTPRCSTARRRAPSPTRRSTSPRRRPSTRRCRVRRGRQRRHRAGLDRRRGVPVRPDGQGHGARRAGARGVRPPRREGLPRQHRAAHRPLPQGQARRLHAPADRDLAGAGGRRPGAAVPVAHVGRLRGRARGEPADRRASCSRRARRPRSSWSWRSASSAARRTASSTRSTRSSTRPPATRCAPSRCSGSGENGRYLLAATFGNVHGVYKPGNVKLRPSILKDIQDEVGAKLGTEKPFDLVFHGGSGSTARGDPRGARLRRGEDERRHRHAVRLHPARSPTTCSATTTAC